ncbi:unnamed protein product [Alternaria alternata]
MGGTMNEMVEVSWNDAMGTRFSNLHFPALRDYVTSLHTFAVRGPIELATEIVCNLSYWNKMASDDKKEKTLVCYDPERCVGNECFPDDPDDESIVARQVGSGSSIGAFHHHRHAHRQISGQGSQKRSGKIEKRSRDYTASFMGSNGRTFTITVTLPSHRGFSQLAEDDPLNDEVIDYMFDDNCGDTDTDDFVLPTGNYYEMEHLVDGQLIAQFMIDAYNRRLPSGATATTAGVSASYFETARTMPIDVTAPPFPGGNNPGVDAGLRFIFPRVMECLGSMTNTANFVGLRREIHKAKTLIMLGSSVQDLDDVKKLAESGTQADAMAVIVKIRAGIAAIKYINHQNPPNVNGRLTAIVNNVGAQFRASQNAHNAAFPNDPTTSATSSSSGSGRFTQRPLRTLERGPRKPYDYYAKHRTIVPTLGLKRFLTF